MSTGMAVLMILAIVTFAGGLLTLGALYLTHWLWLPTLLNYFAKRDLFVTTVEEGTGKWIMKSGRAWRFITASVDTDPIGDWDVSGWSKYKDGKRPDTHLYNAEGEESHWIEKLDKNLPGAMRWVGILPFIYKIHWYNFRWSVLRESMPLDSEDSLVNKRQLENNGKWVASFAKRINYIYLRDAVYYFELIGAETRGASEENSKDKSIGIAVNILMVVTMRVINPYRALFQVHDWLSSVFDILRPSIRSWVATKPFYEVIGKYEVSKWEHDIFLQTTGVPEDVAKKSGEVAVAIVNYIADTYGVRCKRIAFDDVIPPEVYSISTTLRASSEQDKVRIGTLAEAEANRLTIVAGGEAARIKLLAAAMNDPNGILVATLDAYEEMARTGGMTTVIGNNPTQLLIDSAGKAKKKEDDKK
jgi:regulator of protease activity HflC (stomatin/prohibitin superfamily)